MTVRECYALEDFFRPGKGVSRIAQELESCRQTIYNEMEIGQYCPYQIEAIMNTPGF